MFLENDFEPNLNNNFTISQISFQKKKKFLRQAIDEISSFKKKIFWKIKII